jgi:SP family general alpha glucoside:H+ symporter-like MFS transporter
MALSWLSLIWAWFEVPEFKDRTFGELDDLFAQRTPTREFRKRIAEMSMDS